MKTLDFIERHFTKHLTKEDFVAYLHGTILKYALQEQTVGNAANIKYYADKLVEVLSEQPSERLKNIPQIESFDYTKEQPVETPTVKQPTVDPDEPRVFKFKIGDHVIVSKGTDDERTGVIVRLPMDGVDCRTSYVVELDDKNLGWTATVAIDGVDCENAWVAGERNLQLLEEQPELPQEQPHSTLEPNKWYHTKDFTVEELKELLPCGTTIETEKEAWYNGIETEPPTNTQTGVAVGISTSCLGDEPLIETKGSIYFKEWFKISEEN